MSKMVLVPGPLFEYARVPGLQVPRSTVAPAVAVGVSPLRSLVGAAAALSNGGDDRIDIRQDWWLAHAGDIGLGRADAATLFELAYFWRGQSSCPL